MIQDGGYVNLGEPLGSYKEVSIRNTSHKRQVFLDNLVVVGLTGSTLSMGKPCTWGSGQQRGDKLSTACLGILHREYKVDAK